MDMPSLYTVVLDYAGGTYVRQVRANDETMVVKAWRDQFERGADMPEQIEWITSLDIEDASVPVLLQDMTSAWCASFLYKDELALLHIIKTAI